MQEPEYNYLITFTTGYSLLNVAIRFKKLTPKEQEYIKYFNESESKEWLQENIPMSSIGVDDCNIVDIKKIFAIV